MTAVDESGRSEIDCRKIIIERPVYARKQTLMVISGIRSASDPKRTIVIRSRLEISDLYITWSLKIYMTDNFVNSED